MNDTAALPVPSALPPGFRHEARLVTIGASAGGVEALLALFDAFGAADTPPCVVVIHLPPGRESVLTEVFAARSHLRSIEATDKQPIEAGTLYFAPPGYHLLVEPDFTFALSCDAPVHFSRPSIDVLMESAADAVGEQLVAILLTGANDDGARGLARARKAGALTVVQDPAEAQVPDMPRAALNLAQPSYVLPLPQIRALLAQLEACPP